jgi:ADP-dependent NAD(P)H-hydrate dehydratase / NAD(P)H-hydrate epimerase
MCASAPLADARRRDIIAVMRRDDWTADEILTPAEMAATERRLIEAGEVEGYALMRRAGEAVAAEITSRYVAAAGYDVLCGPGNNGGDGYVVARLLSEAGLQVATYASGPPRAGTDAERAHADCGLAARPLEMFAPGDGRVVVDALFGGGFRGQLDGAAREAARRCNASAAIVVAIDMPSGLDGATGVGDPVLKADLTVTFFRPRIGHVLYPGRALCGQLVVADIGIPDAAIEPLGRAGIAVANRPGLWRRFLVPPAVDAHKYSRGHCVTFSGGPSATGAARLAAQGAARIGAGAVTVIAPGSALQANAAHLTSIMIARADDASDLAAFLDRRRVAAAVIGPGFGVGERLRDFVKLLAGREDVAGKGATMRLVIDADAITSFADAPEALFAAAVSRPCRRALQARACAAGRRPFGSGRRVQGAGHGDRGARRACRHQPERYQPACDRRIGRRACRHDRRSAGTALAGVRGRMRCRLDPRRGGAQLRAGPHGGGSSGHAAGRPARAVRARPLNSRAPGARWRPAAP